MGAGNMQTEWRRLAAHAIVRAIMPSAKPAAATISCRLGWWVAAAMVTSILAFPALLRFRPERQAPFDQNLLHRLAGRGPQCVLIGDSMLESRFDDAVLEAIAPYRCAVVAQHGSGSGIWYLIFKNLLAAQERPPRSVIILFRDAQLTLPAWRSTGRYRGTAQKYMPGEEPLFEKIITQAVERQKSPFERLLHTVYPIQEAREAAEEKIDKWALALVARRRDYERIRTETNRLFKVANLRHDQSVDESKEDEPLRAADKDANFDADVRGSFLPPMLEIAKSRGIHLTFFRIKPRPPADNAMVADSPLQAAYQSALQTYLKDHGALYLDETKDPSVTLAYYGSGDHVAPAMARAYAEQFWKTYAGRIEEASGLNGGTAR